MASETYLLFQLGELDCAFRLQETQEVFALPALLELPGLPPWLAGFALFGGQNLPVLDLARLLNIETVARHVDQHLILMRHSPLFCLVERVTDIRKLQPLLPVPEQHSVNDWADGLLKTPEGEIWLIDPARILLQEETQRLAQLRQSINNRRQVLADS